MPHTLYKAKSNGYNFLAKIDSGASHNCISKSLWDKIKTSNKLAKSQITLTGAEGSKLAFLGFADITCSIGTFKPVNEEVNEIHTTSWEKLEGQVHQAHAQL